MGNRICAAIQDTLQIFQNVYFCETEPGKTTSFTDFHYHSNLQESIHFCQAHLR